MKEVRYIDLIQRFPTYAAIPKNLDFGAASKAASGMVATANNTDASNRGESMGTLSRSSRAKIFELLCAIGLN
jgi:hypothetical protein